MNEVRKFLRSKKIKYFFISEVTKYNNKCVNGHLVLTQCAVVIVNEGRKIEMERSWFDITAVVVDNDTITIRSGRKHSSIVCLEQTRVIGEITCYLHMILSQNEFEKLEIPKFDRKVPNSSGECELFKLSTCKNVPMKVKESVAYRRTSLEIESSWKRVDRLFPNLMNCLSLTKRISELRLSLFTPERAWSLLLDNSDTIDYIESFHVANVCETTITFLCERKSGIALSIGEKCDCRMLYRALETGKVNGLSLLEEIAEKDLNNLINNNNFHKLRYFKVTKLPKLNFIEYANKFSNLYALSLPNAGLFIGNVFELLSMADCPNLRGIDLSGNVGRGFIDPKILLPRKLFKIHLNAVKWDVRSLIDFFKLTEKHQTDFLLSMADTDVTDTEHTIESVFALMRNITVSRLCGLTWDRSVVTSDFFLFIAGFTKLSRLSLCGSVNESNVQFLIEFMKQNEQIHVLNLSGSKLIKAKKLLKHLNEFRGINVINISDCGIRNEHVDILAENVIANGSIREIIMDGSSLTSLEQWKSFVNKMQKSNASFRLSYPVRDMERFGVAPNSPEAKKFAKKLYQLSHRKKGDTRHYMIDISISDCSDTFPTYLLNGQIEQIDGMTVADAAPVEEEPNEKVQPQKPKRKAPVGPKRRSPSPVRHVPKTESNWKMPILSIPEIDNTSIIDRQNNEFAIHRMLKWMTQDKS